jgi:adenosine kinase
MSALICGSLAYDTIMVFNGRFKDHILPDKIHMLNVSFLVPTMRRNFGGCAGNIAYTLKLLGGQGFPMGTVGHDFGPYHAWLDEHHIDRRYVKEIAGEFTAQGFVTTDLDDNQIWAFHPGAMSHSQVQPVPSADGISIGIVSPDGREGMIAHAEQFSAANLPFIFDPGQGLPLFNGVDLLKFIEQATWLAVNDYEAQVVAERIGLTHAQIAERVQALIVTRGAQGSLIYHGGNCTEIPPAKPLAIKDPTGCGDAYRAGLLYGLMNGFDWETTGRIASLVGALKIESNGPQNHRFTMAEFSARFQESFGYRLAA